MPGFFADGAALMKSEAFPLAILSAASLVGLMPLLKAQSVEKVYMAFDPAPLDTFDELDHFYVDQLNEVRGNDRIPRLALGIRRQLGKGQYKAFVMGHSGVGISTELTRLERMITKEARTLRLSATRDFDPVNFKAFDIPLRIAIGLAEETAKPAAEGGAGTPVPDELLRPLLDWFNIEKKQLKTTTEATASLAAQAGGAGGLWEKFLPFSLAFKGEIKRSSGRQEEVIKYRLKSVTELTRLANGIIQDCNERLRAACGREWLVIGDDFDKPGIPLEGIQTTFIDYGGVLADLRCHLVVDIPISLGHSSRANQLPPQFEGPHTFPDTPVFDPEHKPHKAGREALQAVISQRMDTALFARGQQNRLITASGGNLRDLFTLIVEAATNAELRQAGQAKITQADCDAAIQQLRKEYRDHLGETPYDVEKAGLKDKLDRLSAIYRGEPAAQVRDATLYALLQAKAVQEFNGKGWFGVHPLIVDFLTDLKDRPELDALRAPDTRVLPGGTL